MASKPRKPEPQPLTTLPAVRGIDLLRTRHAVGEHLRAQAGLDAKQVASWTQATSDLLHRVFGEDREAAEFATAGPTGDETEKELLRQQVAARLSLLADLVQRAAGLYSDADGSARASTAGVASRVLVAPSADATMTDGVVQFLEKLGCEAVVVEASERRRAALLDRIEQSGELAFSILLLAENENRSLELGLLLGKLGRKRVCVLHRASVDLAPYGDTALSIALDDGGNWEGKLAKALREADVAADFARLVTA